MRRKSAAGNSPRSSSACAAGATSASTKRATLLRKSSWSRVKAIMPSSPAASAPPSAQRRGGLDVDTLADDHDAVALAGGLDRDVVVQHVLQHRSRIALEGIAVAAGARLLEGYDIAVGELARLLAVDALLARARVDHRRGERTRLAAEEPVRREPLTLGEIRQLALVGEEAQVAPDAAAAAKRSRPGRVADELEALDDDGLVRLLGLDGDVGGVERVRHRLAAVSGGARARAREHQLVGDEAAPARAVPAAERRVGEVRGRRRHAPGQRGGQGADDRLERAIADDRARAAARGRARIQERALG